MIYRYKGAHFHILSEENGKMTYHDACDCGCQNFQGDVTEGDILASSHGQGLALAGNIKGVTIISTRIRFIRPGSLEDVRIEYRTREYIDQHYPKE